MIETSQYPSNTGLRLRTRMGNYPIQGNDQSAPYQAETSMKKRRDRVCGADVHKDLIVATITGDDVPPIRENFGTTKSELRRFRNWLVANKCEQVAFEATGVYWMPIYDALSQTVDAIVANPLQIKTIPNDKSDSKDSKRIATLCLNGQIKRSRVFTDEDRIGHRLSP